MKLGARARRVPALVWVVSIGIALSVLAVGVRFAPALAAQACATSTHRTRGVVKSFGPERAFVNIAHEKIDGYMEAMTMSFEPRRPEQLAGVGAGDKVSFSFTETDDGRRLLDSLEKK
jgi:Cu/Ag efflux protein CusF